MDYLPTNNTEKYEIPLNEGIPSVTIFSDCAGPSAKNCTYNDRDLFGYAFIGENKTAGSYRVGTDHCRKILPRLYG